MKDNIFDLSIKRNENEIKRCLLISKKVDKLIIDLVNDNIEPKLVAAIVADALGRFLEKFDNKEELWKILEKTIKRQSKIN